jgi:hypothetical protein
MNKKFITLGVLASLIALVLSIIALVGGNSQPAPTTRVVGGSTDELWQAKGGIKVGTTGTQISKQIFTSPNFGETNRCDWIIAGTAAITFAATTTRDFDCAVTGVTPGDSIVVSLPTTTPTVFGGVQVVGVNASSTAGFVTFRVYNGTGTSVTLGQSTVGSSTVIHVLDN